MWAITKLFVRRWYVAAPMLLLTLVGAVTMLRVVAPSYVLTAYVQLVPPHAIPDGQNGGPSNPWQDLGLGALGQAAVYATQDEEYRQHLADAGYAGTFDISLGYPSPVVTIEVTAPTEAAVKATAQQVIDHFNSVVTTLQSQYNVGAQRTILTQRLDQGGNLKVETGGAKKAAVLVFAVGLMAAGGSAIGLDALMGRRRPPAAGRVAAKVPAWNGPTVAAGSAAATSPRGVAALPRGPVLLRGTARD
jgi:hypothetical protein